MTAALRQKGHREEMRFRYRSITYGVPDMAHRASAGDDEMERLLRDTWSVARTPVAHGLATWHPPLDMYETPDRYVVRVELAGAREEDLDITLFADRLIISGRRVPDYARDGQQVAYHVAGIMYGDFRLTLRVPQGIDHEKTEASYEGGFLTISLPKQ
jgi:HSP20 family molecular chaperone IbpA